MLYGQSGKLVFLDFNSDGLQDVLVVLREDSARKGLMLNVGSKHEPRFRRLSRYELPELQLLWEGTWADVLPADLDGDGDVDFLAFTYGTTCMARYFENTGTSVAMQLVERTQAPAHPMAGVIFSNSGYYYQACSAALGDFVDGDGDLDLILREDGNVRFFRNSGSPTAPVFTAEAAVPGLPPALELVSPLGNRVVLFDMDNDGDLDLIISAELGYANPCFSFFFDNKGTPSAPMFVKEGLCVCGAVDLGPRIIGVSDFNSDGIPEMHLTSGYHYNPNRLWVNTYSSPVSPGGCYGLVGEFGGHLMGQPSPLQWAFGVPCFADLDGDGDYDAVVTSKWAPQPTVYLMMNIGTPGEAQFAAPVQIGRDCGYTRGCHLVDLDGDGDFDLYCICNTVTLSDSLVLFENTGTPTSPAFASRYVSASFWDESDVGQTFTRTWDFDFFDIDADGDLDLLVGMTFLENIGSRTHPHMRSRPLYPFNTTTWRLPPTMVDLDGDGTVDILGPERNCFLNVGTPSHPRFERLNSPPVFLQTTRYRRFVDIDGDGDLDVFSSGLGVGGVIYYPRVGCDYCPVIEGMTPSTGSVSGGVRVTLHGKFLSNATLAPVAVSIGGRACLQVSVLSTSAVSCVAPPGVGAWRPVRLQRASDGRYSAETKLFSYAVPAVESVSVAPTAGGRVAVLGRGFGLAMEDNSTRAVTFHCLSPPVSLPCTAITFVSPLELSCVVLPGVGTGCAATVTVAGQSSTTPRVFTYRRPLVTQVQPSSGVHSETNVTITGANFGVGAMDSSLLAVRIGGVPCSTEPPLGRVSDSLLRCRVGFATGWGSVEVEVAGQRSEVSSASPVQFRYLPRPTPSVVLSTQALTLHEGGAPLQYRLSLSMRPTASVTVSLHTTSLDGRRVMFVVNASAAADAFPSSVSAASSVTWLPDEWSQERQVVVSPVDDQEDCGCMSAKGQLVHRITSEDSKFAAAASQMLDVSVLEDDQAAVRLVLLLQPDGSENVSPSLSEPPSGSVTSVTPPTALMSLVLREGVAAYYGVLLLSRPTSNVTVFAHVQRGGTSSVLQHRPTLRVVPMAEGEHTQPVASAVADAVASNSSDGGADAAAVEAGPNLGAAFTPTNWMRPQRMRVLAADDQVAMRSSQFTLLHSVASGDALYRYCPMLAVWIAL